MTKSAQKSSWRDLLVPIGREEKLKREMWRLEKCGGQPRCTSLITCSSSAPPPPTYIVVDGRPSDVCLRRLPPSREAEK